MKNNFLESLRREAQSPNSAYIQFLQRYKKTDNALHLFFEGQDDPSFYLNFVSQLVDEDIKIHIYNSGNKDYVYHNYSRINWSTYEKKRVLFFVDKDHSDILGITYPESSNIFVTKYYSIENYLVNQEVMERILVDLLHITSLDFLEKIKKDFVIQHSKFCDLMLVITSWIIYWRRRNQNPNLNNLKVSDFFQFSPEVEIKRNTLPKKLKLLEYLNRQCGIDTEPYMWKEILSIAYDLKNIRDHKKHLRGKFELWFIVFYTNTLIDFLNKDRQPGEKKIKCHTTLGLNNAIEILGTRCKIPSDLKSFLQLTLETN